MDNLGNRIKLARETFPPSGMTQKELGDAAGISQTTIADIERGRNKGTKHIVDIAKSLKVSIEWLNSGKGEMRPRHKEDANITAGPDIRGCIPLISWVQAGNFSMAADLHQPGIADEFVETTVKIKNHTFALRVKGDSMEPIFSEGMILIVEPEMEAIHNDYVIAKNGDEEATFKQLIRDGGDWYLKPLNDRYPIKPLGECSIVGVVRSAERQFR